MNFRKNAMSILLKLFVSICFILMSFSAALSDVKNKTNLKSNNNSGASAPVKKIEKPSSQPSSAKSNAKLRTDGLFYSDDLTSIFIGDFESVEFTKESTHMIGLVDGYLHVFSEKCNAALPKNKVELTMDVCDREAWLENGYGEETPGSRHCDVSHKEGTGKYADPEVNNLNNSLYDAKYGGVTNFFKVLTNPNSLRDMSNQAESILKSKKDMDQLLSINGCASQATKLFQANLIRFGRGIEAITTPGLKPPKGKMKEYQLELLTTSGVLWCGRDLCDNNMPLIDMLKTADHPKGPVVLVCQYTRSSLGYGKDFTYGFWYKAPPANIQALLAEDKKGNSFRPEDEKDNTGRLRWLGTQAAQQCPETKQKAKDLRRAALKETGYPDEPTAKK